MGPNGSRECRNPCGLWTRNKARGEMTFIRSRQHSVLPGSPVHKGHEDLVLQGLRDRLRWTCASARFDVGRLVYYRQEKGQELFCQPSRSKIL